MWPNPQFPADLITFTEEILNGKLHFFAGYTKVCNHPQPTTTIYNHPQPPTTIHNNPQLSTTTRKTTHNPPKNYTKDLLYKSLYLLFFGWAGCLFLSALSNSLDVKSDDFCLLEIWIYELLKLTTIHYLWTILWVF